MSENILEMSQGNTGHGKVEIAPEVIEVIAGIAASEVEGVAQMRGNFASGVVERLGKKNHGKGVKVELTEEGIRVEVYCLMKFGISIPAVAQEIQDNIRQALLNMTALEAQEINIHVVGILFENQKLEPEIEQEI
ncbi:MULTISPECIES: Asp23/Gls24 family envelope stress response protein [Bacillus]|uniref:Asp23/Gls24 family envelope stress response protein n=1 Tax=Bacillus infantis TaxID=324767 RepID=A0A5D4STZ7_9BACI|nr:MULTISPECIES: Asp23/Gls24 family envelope stress response protein [Bacillus]MCA1036166.1 Asp23/Gls24 family envelope stress response protein [Bacillus infantis]PLR72570.1 Asp23/Gls24 family envelope stress response protein [Bacillus sp. UMB0728]TYS66429.1 Asp23/Gls24 family envelope stress response protein [Bacillus infantis]